MVYGCCLPFIIDIMKKKISIAEIETVISSK